MRWLRSRKRKKKGQRRAEGGAEIQYYSTGVTPLCCSRKKVSCQAARSRPGN
jgi:hypothetical protein